MAEAEAKAYSGGLRGDALALAEREAAARPGIDGRLGDVIERLIAQTHKRPKALSTQQSAELPESPPPEADMRELRG